METALALYRWWVPGETPSTLTAMAGRGGRQRGARATARSAMYMGGMSGLFVTDAQIAEARKLALEITDPIFELIARNTTISVERTVLRWFGVDGVGNLGAPLVNLMCDRLKEAGVLNKGAAYWYGRAPR